jgi:SNF2 family DNA or RNA helicase
MLKPAPQFDRSFLIELCGGIVYRHAERLFEAAAVESVCWESPVLKGQVKGLEQSYSPELNLRSTVFAESRCSCADGRKRKVCAHAIAIALHYQALQHEQKNERIAVQAAAAEPAVDRETIVAADPAAAKLRSIRLSAEGLSLRMLVFLPPNFEAAIARDAIVVKVEAAAAREIVPLGNLNTGRAYNCSTAQRAAMQLIEHWCGGQLASLLQLNGVQLRQLLDCLLDEPVVYWVKKPNAPIDWSGGQLADVHQFLPESPPAAATALREEPTAPVAQSEDSQRPRFKRGISLRQPSKPNLRRLAEASAQKTWKPRSGDFPTAKAVADSMKDYSAQQLVVDGSPSFVAIRLPAGQDEQVRPLRNILKAGGFMLEPSNRKWWLRDRHKTLNFLALHWQSLKQQWQAEFTANFQAKFKNVELSALQVETQQDAGAFKLEIKLSNSTDEAELRRAIGSGQSYVDNKDGSITLLDQDSVGKLHEIERAISGQADRPFTPNFTKRIETQELSDVEDLLDEMTEGWQPPQAWQSRSRALKQVGALEAAPVRAGFDAVLRSYQRIGVAWLWHLYRNQLGGILADEMGLGKTLQALALIECVRQQAAEPQPALVVCPASLVENWAREASRFTPGLTVVKHHGPRRAKEPAELERQAIIVTSYGTLRQDAELLTTMDWSVVIGDEAQHIKNRRTQNARTLTRLHSGGRFLLTGTPVENSLDDLLSLFAFLMPGYLQQPASQLSADDRNWHSKRQTTRAAAYILRRTKKEVAPELPDKIEKTFFCELGSRQSRFYQETLEKTRRDIFNLEMSGANSGRVRFAAFTELLRLRQACVDPRIIDDEYPAAESAKLAAFDEVLDECIDAGSRILVFSSFVSALKLLAQHLELKGHKYCYLDGQTKKRLAICDEFNGDASIPVFLISLKAGGTGLNLTGADTVVHYDPWWNPAAEAQATDRAHRIGQKRVVTSIKLIAANTVEEKVLELQARKAEILKELFEESEAANSKVSLDDIKNLLG